jgi:hypothetical protein
LIYQFFSRVAVKLGDESRTWDRKTFSYADAVRVEEATGMSYPEWEWRLERQSVTAVAALLHVLRLRDGVPSDFKAMAFNMSDLVSVPLHDDDSEYTADEVAEEIIRQTREAQAAADPGPTRAAAGPEPLPEGEGPASPRPTSPSSPASTTSARGSSASSRTRTSSSSRKTPTST